jgi:hypothetical protein
MLKSFVFAGIVALSAAKHSMHSFGAIHDDTSYSAALTNAQALKSAILHANSSDIDRVVHVPEGYRYTMMPVLLDNVQNVTLEIDGVILCA